MKITIDTDLARTLGRLGPIYRVTIDCKESNKLTNSEIFQVIKELTPTEIFHVLSEVLLNERLPLYILHKQKEDLEP